MSRAASSRASWVVRSPSESPREVQTMKQKLSILVTVLGALASLLSAAAMRDHVRLVEIVGLFASGAGTGAGLAALFLTRARAVERATSDQGRGLIPLEEDR